MDDGIYRPPLRVLTKIEHLQAELALLTQLKKIGGVIKFSSTGDVYIKPPGQVGRTLSLSAYKDLLSLVYTEVLTVVVNKDEISLGFGLKELLKKA